VIRWKAIVAALVLFFAGVLSGVMGQRLWDTWQVSEIPTRQPRRGEPPPPGSGPRLSFLQRMTRDLQLTADQAERINAIIKSSQKRMREIWRTTIPKARQEMSNTRAAIAAVLTEKQRARMEQLFKQHDRGRRGGGRFRGRDGKLGGPPPKARRNPKAPPPPAPPPPGPTNAPPPPPPAPETP